MVTVEICSAEVINQLVTAKQLLHTVKNIINTIQKQKCRVSFVEHSA